MTTLTVWKFNTSDGADRVMKKLIELQKQQLIEIQDAAIVSWRYGRKKPKTRQALDLVSASAMDGAFWGMLFGCIFLVPVVGILLGSTLGALSGSLQDYGINDDFIKDIKAKVTEGTSALFLLTGKVTADKVEAAFSPDEKGELIQSNLSIEQEAKLREHFGEENFFG
ncbi:MAG: DUF1269 domain-containing protein [Actinomycetota bacterium]